MLPRYFWKRQFLSQNYLFCYKVGQLFWDYFSPFSSTKSWQILSNLCHHLIACQFFLNSVGHLQTWQGYPRIGLDLRITLVPSKSGILDPDRARAGKPVFPFCPILAQPGHLQTSAGYLRIRLDLRIPTVPKNPDFRIRIGHILRKTEKTVSVHFALLRPN